jgi:hypothetical protein
MVGAHQAGERMRAVDALVIAGQLEAALEPFRERPAPPPTPPRV